MSDKKKIDGLNPNMSSKKKAAVVDVLFDENLDELTPGGTPQKKRPFKQLTSDEVANAETMTRPQYIEELRDDEMYKEMTKVVFKQPSNKEYIRIIPYSGTHYYDFSNPQRGLRKTRYINSIKSKINGAKDAEGNFVGEVYVLFGGDMIGREWATQSLAEASVKTRTVTKRIETVSVEGLLDEESIQDGVEVRQEGQDIIFYAGLNARKEWLKRDINSVLKSGANVVLMRGLEEHNAMRNWNRDIMQEAFDEISQERTNKGEFYPTLQYISEGVSIQSNAEIYGADGNLFGKYIIGIQTNNNSKAKTMKGAIAAAEKWNGPIISDVTFITNTNVVGKIGPNAFACGMEATYQNAARGQKPDPMPRTSLYDLYFEDKGRVCVVEGGLGLEARKNDDLIMKRYIEYQKLKILTQIVKLRLQEMDREIDIAHQQENIGRFCDGDK